MCSASRQSHRRQSRPCRQPLPLQASSSRVCAPSSTHSQPLALLALCACLAFPAPARLEATTWNPTGGSSRYARPHAMVASSAGPSRPGHSLNCAGISTSAPFGRFPIRASTAEWYAACCRTPDNRLSPSQLSPGRELSGKHSSLTGRWAEGSRSTSRKSNGNRPLLLPPALMCAATCRSPKGATWIFPPLRMDSSPRQRLLTSFPEPQWQSRTQWRAPRLLLTGLPQSSPRPPTLSARCKPQPTASHRRRRVLTYSAQSRQRPISFQQETRPALTACRASRTQRMGISRGERSVNERLA